MAKFTKHKIDDDAYNYLAYIVSLTNIDYIIDRFLAPNYYNNASSLEELSDFFYDGSLPPEISANGLSGSPKAALTLKEIDLTTGATLPPEMVRDAWGMYAANTGIVFWLHGGKSARSEMSKEDLDLIDDLFQDKGIGDRQDYAREFFIQNHAYSELAYAGQELSVGGPRAQYPTVVVAAEALYDRLIIWRKLFDINKSKNENLRVITAAELVALNDKIESSSAEVGDEGLNYLEEVFSKVYGNTWSFKMNEMKQMASSNTIGPNGSTNTNNWDGFYMAFKPLDGNLPSIDPKGRKP